MLPVAYRVVKGFATFFGVMGILACICGLIAGIIMHGDDSKKGPKPLADASRSATGVAGPSQGSDGGPGSSTAKLGAGGAGVLPGVGVGGAGIPGVPGIGGIAGVGAPDA